MRVISKRMLRLFWKRHPQVQAPLSAWYAEAMRSSWASFKDVRKRYPSADMVKGNRVIFNIKGNDCRLVVRINFDYKIVYIRFIGTHSEYNKVSAEDV